MARKKPKIEVEVSPKVIVDDLANARGVLAQIDKNVAELRKEINHMKEKISRYELILSRPHKFRVESMNAEIERTKEDIKKLQKIIRDEGKRKRHFTEIVEVLEEKLDGVSDPAIRRVSASVDTGHVTNYDHISAGDS